MPTNPYFRQNVRSEQTLYEDIVIESLKMFGQDLYYLPRDIVNEDKIFGDDVPSRFNSSYKIEMYIENVEGFDGEGDLFTRFGVEIRDEATFIVARKRWLSIIGRYDNEINSERPREGDLIYVPMSKSMFEIMHVEHEQPFYQLSNLPTYKMRCTLFEYSDEDFDTGVEEIDNIERDAAYGINLTLESRPPILDVEDGIIVHQTIHSNGLKISGEISSWSPDSKILKLVHVGSSDGSFREFTSAKPLTINNNLYNITNVEEVMDNALNNQNDNFYTETLEFLDFTETNPFGEPGGQ